MYLCDGGKKKKSSPFDPAELLVAFREEEESFSSTTIYLGSVYKQQNDTLNLFPYLQAISRTYKVGTTTKDTFLEEEGDGENCWGRFTQISKFERTKLAIDAHSLL